MRAGAVRQYYGRGPIPRQQGLQDILAEYLPPFRWERRGHACDRAYNSVASVEVDLSPPAMAGGGRGPFDP